MRDAADTLTLLQILNEAAKHPPGTFPNLTAQAMQALKDFDKSITPAIPVGETPVEAPIYANPTPQIFNEESATGGNAEPIAPQSPVTL